MHQRVIKVQRDADLSGNPRGEVVAADVLDLVGQHGLPLVVGPVPPVGGKQHYRPQPADRGGRAKPRRLAQLDPLYAAELCAHDVGELAQPSVGDGVRVAAVTADGSKSECDSHGHPGDADDIKRGHECQPMIGQHRPQSRRRGDRDSGLLGLAGNRVSVHEVVIKARLGEPTGRISACRFGLLIARVGRVRPLQVLPTEMPRRPGAKCGCGQSGDREQCRHGHGGAGGRSAASQERTHAQRGARQNAHLNRAPQQDLRDGTHCCCSRRIFSRRARSFAVSFRFSVSRTSRCSREPRKTRLTRSPNRRPDTSSKLRIGS